MPSETLALPAAQLRPGTTFAGRYEVLEELGRGGMGRVYKVYDRAVEVTVALKLLNPEIAADPGTIQRFRSELRLARMITHKNVCRMHDLGQDGAAYYITMEYVPGEDLKSFIRRSGQLAPAKAAAIGIQVCEGLAEAHRLGVVHRDLKPQNIMIDADGNARIMDFGIARSLAAPGATVSGAVIGTPDYMSPEQVEGGEADPRTDIYAVGVILFEMLTGLLPFEGGTPIQAAARRTAEPAPDPRSIDDRIPEALSRVVRRCLERDRGRRYQSAAELLEALEGSTRLTPAAGERAVPRHAAAERDSAAAPGLPGRAAGGFRTRVYARAAMLLAVVLLLAAAAWLIVRPGRRMPSAGPQTAATPASSWKNSIAVLPFRDYSAAKDQEGLCDGMTEAIIVRLSAIAELKVTGTNSVWRFKEAARDFGRIGADLGVANLVDGSIQREANRIRVTAKLIAGASDAVLWSDTYDRELTSIFDLQDTISKAVADALQVRLLPREARPAAAGGPPNLPAYEYYMKGLSFIKSKFVLTFREEDFRKGVEMFDKAIELDPDYAMSYYGLCWAYEYHHQITSDPRDRDMMIRSAETAQRLDPASALTNAMMGYALYEYKGERDKALDYCRRSLAINPNDGDVNFLTGMCYLYHGLYDQGIRFLTKAHELDPYNFWTPYKLAMCYVGAGDFDKADYYFAKYFELTPPVEPLVYPGRNIGLQIMMGRLEKADELVRRGEKAAPDAEWVRKYRAILHAVRGERDQALSLYRNSEVYALLGMNEESIAELGHEIRGSVFNPYIYYQDLVHDPFYDKLRGDPRFKKLVEREKGLYDAAVMKYGDMAKGNE